MKETHPKIQGIPLSQQVVHRTYSEQQVREIRQELEDMIHILAGALSASKKGQASQAEARLLARLIREKYELEKGRDNAIAQFHAISKKYAVCQKLTESFTV